MTFSTCLFSESDFYPGDVSGPNEEGIYTAEIHCGQWLARIELYGLSEEHAEALRNYVFAKLQQPFPRTKS